MWNSIRAGRFFHECRTRVRPLATLLVLAVAPGAHAAVAPAGTPAALTGLVGGLIVQLGTDDAWSLVTLGRTGRYLIQVLASDPQAVAQVQELFREQADYGLLSADRLLRPDHLPYAENLINLVVVRIAGIPSAELFRVIAPRGAAVLTESARASPADLRAAGFSVETSPGLPTIARKPWPADMDEWSHPRHDAGGNTVSNDTRVGPPERVRWIAGALREVEGMVSAGGRIFYGGILARDAFNGLRLWHRDVNRAEYNLRRFRLPRLQRNRARPIASDRFVFAVERGRLVALDAADGKLVRVFPNMPQPMEAAHVRGVLVACNEAGVRAWRVRDGRALWTHPAPAPGGLVVDKRVTCFVCGRQARGEKTTLVALDTTTGEVRWRRSDYRWLNRVSRLVLHGNRIACELSSLTDDDSGNAIHVLSAATGEQLWEKAYPPGMNHVRQARAMFVDGRLWVLHGGKINTTDPENIKRLPIRISALNPRTGETLITYPAGLAHCFPPVATRRFLFSGVMDLTDLDTGKLTVRPITKANCSREAGWLPANGLIYTTPKHCTCWPILRGFVALAAARSDHAAARIRAPADRLDFALEYGTVAADPNAPPPAPSDWPLYRHDRWRSGSTPARCPSKFKTLWSVSLGGTETSTDGPIVRDWRENDFVKGPVTPPTVAYGLVYVARPDAHEVVAVDADTGGVRWRFTADGRIDSPPTLHRGLCLFGSRAGSVYALRADSGRLVWRLRAAPLDERIVAYGQLESPWPVPGTILVRDNVAYFAAGRQPLADGGLLVFAVDPLTGRRFWVRRINTIPQKGFYENSGVEFDSFDILHQEGDAIALSRWLISLDGRKTRVDKWNAFAKLNTGGGTVWVPRGFWTYGPRHQQRFGGEARLRPLCAFRDGALVSSLNGATTLFRRDFRNGETFNARWITGWEVAKIAREGGNPFRSHRLAAKARWMADPYSPKPAKPGPRRPGTQLYNNLYGMVLTEGDRLLVIHRDGRLKCLDMGDGSVIGQVRLPPPVWDGMAVARDRIYLTTRDGGLLCVGD